MNGMNSTGIKIICLANQTSSFFTTDVYLTTNQGGTWTKISG